MANLPRLSSDELFQASWIANVLKLIQPKFAYRSHHASRVLRFDRNRAYFLAVRNHVGHLGHAAVNLVTGALLVHVHHTQAPARLSKFVDELLECVLCTRQWRRGDAERVKDALHLGSG